ncbi:SUKH-3 domain-containing protein [Streptomyces antimicrobicus]|uniref:SUKH-3 domain-containing protein n=1 Tax=Streptomyces antimicrobicus TaxID=2883108 RepID=A0ABS8B4Z8_9ACTN|nr:SUKH-3 domain-containing protein [Streptomyces antimicrobicus]MCB5179667.1 SUKH-3 domain-containing protein [Streptomyces antimicrobicus]
MAAETILRKPTDVLARAGWRPGRDAGDAAMLAILKTAALGQWTLFPAAEQAVREFHGLRIAPSPDGGRDVAATGCVVDPQEARYAGPPLQRLGNALGVRLFPFGRTDQEAPLGVDEEGRLFTLGVGGAWLLGGSAREGLIALAEGTRPVRLRPRERLWRLSDMPADLTAGVRAALVAVYVLHHTGVFSARALRLRVTTLRGVGVLALDETYALRPGRLDASAEPLARAMADELAAAGLSPHGCEIAVGVPAPSGTTGPLATLDCTITLNGPAGRPTLTLSAPMGASVGPTAKIFDACEAAFAAWAAQR